jgi:hypothetical protein
VDWTWQSKDLTTLRENALQISSIPLVWTQVNEEGERRRRRRPVKKQKNKLESFNQISQFHGKLQITVVSVSPSQKTKKLLVKK